MAFYFKKDKNASQICRKIYDVHGVTVVQESVCQKWFTEFFELNEQTTLRVVFFK